MKLINDELPTWMSKDEQFDNFGSKNSFLVNNANKITGLLEKFIDSSETKRSITASNFINLILMVLFLSISESPKFIWMMLLINLFYLYQLDITTIISVLKRTATAVGSVVVIMSPMFFFNQRNFNFIFLFKTFTIIFLVISRFTNINFNSIVLVFKKFKFSNFMIFIVTIMILYLKVLAVLLRETVFSITLKSFGKLKRPYYTVGSLFGGLYLTSIRMSNQVYEAMVARCFTGNYVLKRKSNTKKDLTKNIISSLAVCLLFIFI